MKKTISILTFITTIILVSALFNACGKKSDDSPAAYGTVNLSPTLAN